MTNCNAWLSPWNWIDRRDVLITTANENASHLAFNIAKRASDEYWRAENLVAGATDFFVDIDLRIDRQIDCLAIFTDRATDTDYGDFWLSISDTDLVQWQLDADGGAAGGGAAYDSGPIASSIKAGYGYHVIFFDAPIAARYIRLTIDAISRAYDPVNFEKGFTDIARVWAGPAHRFPINFDYGHSTSWRSQTSITRAARARVDHVDVGASYRAWQFTFSGIGDVEEFELMELDRQITTAKQILFGITDEPAELPYRSMLCRFDEDASIVSIGPDLWQKPYPLIESL